MQNNDWAPSILSCDELTAVQENPKDLTTDQLNRLSLHHAAHQTPHDNDNAIRYWQQAAHKGSLSAWLNIGFLLARNYVSAKEDPLTSFDTRHALANKAIGVYEKIFTPEFDPATALCADVLIQGAVSFAVLSDSAFIDLQEERERTTEIRTKFQNIKKLSWRDFNQKIAQLPALSQDELQNIKTNIDQQLAQTDLRLNQLSDLVSQFYERTTLAYGFAIDLADRLEDVKIYGSMLNRLGLVTWTASDLVKSVDPENSYKLIKKATAYFNRGAKIVENADCLWNAGVIANDEKILYPSWTTAERHTYILRNINKAIALDPFLGEKHASFISKIGAGPVTPPPSPRYKRHYQHHPIV